MKIMMLGHSVPSTGPGVSLGISRYTYSLSNALRAMRNDVELIIRNDKPVNENWISQIYAPKFSWIPYPIFAYPHLLGRKADVYHSDFITTGAALMWARKRPAVVSMHDAIPFTYDIGSMPINQRVSTRWYMRCFKSARKAEAIILMSEHASSEAIKLVDLDPDKVHAVYNGIDHSIFRPMKNPPHKNIRLGYLGGLDGRKNVEMLVESFKMIQAEYDDVELHVAGGGSNLEKFRDMKIRNAVFYGSTDPDKAPEFYNNIDIFVMPSLHEGFGMMTLEAMSCGLPVIGVDRSSTPEILGDAGLLVKPDVDSITKAISRLLDSGSRRKSVAKKCLDRSKQFSWERCAKDTMKVYGELI